MASTTDREASKSPRTKSRAPSVAAWASRAPTRNAESAEPAPVDFNYAKPPIRESKRFDVPTESMLQRVGGPSDLKAGVGVGGEGILSKDEQQTTIYKYSKGSKHFDDQVRRDKETLAKAQRFREILAKKELQITGDEEACADAILEQLQEKRDLSRVIALIDADAFYAACHEREDPSLAGTAFGVGGGMLTTASYEARKYGCRSAMPLFIAKKLCKHIKSIPLDPPLYIQASKDIMAVLEKYGPIAPASLDEAYVDLTDYCANQNVTPTEAIGRLRAEVFATTRLTVSAGVSPNKTLSKIAADINKPNGQFVIDQTTEACMAFIRDQPLRKCYGIGRVTEMLLNGVGLKTVGDIYQQRRKLYLLREHLPSRGVFRWLLSLYLGLGSNSVKRAKRGDRKSYGAEKTFHPTSDRNELDDMVRRIAKSLAKDIARSQFSGRTITLSIKHDNFRRVTRAYTPGNNIWISSYQDMVRYGLMLLHKEIENRAAAIKRGEVVKGGQNPVLKARLLGLRLTNLRDDREVAKANKLDGYVRAKPAKLSNVIDLLSDSDDPDILHDSEEEEEEDGDFQKRAIQRLVQEAEGYANDGHDVEDLPSIEYSAIGGGVAYRGGWVTVDDGEDEELEKARQAAKKQEDNDDDNQDNALESKARSLTTQSARNAELAGFGESGSETESEETVRRKRSSPEGPGASSSRTKRAKTDASQSPPAGALREHTCPICQRVLVGSEAAMTGHIDKCLISSEKSSSKKKKKGKAPFGPSKKQLFFPSSSSSASSSKLKANAKAGSSNAKKGRAL